MHVLQHIYDKKQWDRIICFPTFCNSTSYQFFPRTQFQGAFFVRETLSRQEVVSTSHYQKQQFMSANADI